MGRSEYNTGHFRTGGKTAIWVSFLLAVSLHAVFFLLPLLPETPKPGVSEVRIDLQFSKVSPAPTESIEPLAVTVPKMPAPQPEATLETEPVPENEADENEPDRQVAEIPKEQDIANPARENIAPASPGGRTALEQLDDLEKELLTRALLTRQFIKEESMTEQLFGRPLVTNEADPVANFQVPVRTSMITLLDKPMPDLPFAYQEGLVHFAYDPGVRGDLQRFWDVITPEIAFRTRYGTEVRCIWILILGGCAWK